MGVIWVIGALFFAAGEMMREGHWTTEFMRLLACLAFLSVAAYSLVQFGL